MASSCSGHHENTMITLRIKRKNGADVAPEFYSQDETRPIAKRLTSKTGELLSKTSQGGRGGHRQLPLVRGARGAPGRGSRARQSQETARDRREHQEDRPPGRPDFGRV